MSKTDRTHYYGSVDREMSPYSARKYDSIGNFVPPEKEENSMKKHQENKEEESLFKGRRGVILISCLGVVSVEVLMLSIITPFYPKYAKDHFDASNMMIGLIFTLYSLATGFSSIVFGHLSNTLKGGRLPLLLIGSSAFAAFTISFSFVDTLILVCIWRFLQGLSAGAAGTSNLALMSDYFPKQLGQVMGLCEICSGLGYVIGPPLGGFLYTFGGYKFPFFVSGGVITLNFFLSFYIHVISSKNINGDTEETLKLIPDDNERQKKPGKCIEKFPEFYNERVISSPVLNQSSRNFQVVDESEIENLLDDTNVTLKDMFNMDVVVGCVSVIACMIGFGILLPTYSDHLDDSFDIGTIEAGGLIAVPSVFYGIFSYAIGKKIDSSGNRRFKVIVVLIGILSLMLSYILIGPIPWVPCKDNNVLLGISIMGLVVLSWGLSCTIVPGLPLMIESIDCEGNDKKKRIVSGLSSGIFTSAISFGAIIGPLMGSFATQQFGYRWGYVCLSGFFLFLSFFVVVDLIVTKK